MKEITGSILEYREAERNLWNVYFRSIINGPFDDNLTRYAEIDSLLFRSLVLKPIGMQKYEFSYRNDAISFIEIRANKQSKALRLRICEDVSSRNRSWSEPQHFSGADKATFEFIELFDWDRYGWVSYPFYRVKIKKFPAQKHLENFEALIEIQTAQVFNGQKNNRLKELD